MSDVRGERQRELAKETTREREREKMRETKSNEWEIGTTLLRARARDSRDNECERARDSGCESKGRGE